MNATLVASVIIENEGKFLLVQQARSRRQAGKWGLPGGKPEHSLGETLFEAAKRETIEEIGLSVELTGLAGLIRSGHATEPNLFICFTGQLKGSLDQLHLKEGEITGARWLSLEEIEAGVVPLRMAPLAEMLRRVKNGQVYPLEMVLHEAIDQA